MFIELKIDDSKCRSAQPCDKCVTGCPVDLFVASSGVAGVDRENLDECTLCDICLQTCPSAAITVVKLYEN